MRAIIELLRIRQWYKNSLLFAPLIFAQLLFVFRDIVQVTLGFLVFCMVSSSLYIINDLKDCSRDAHHPQKMNRPLPSGRISRRFAVFLIIILGATAAIICSQLPVEFSLVTLAYIILTLGYTFYFKEIPIVDVFSLGVGFILRVLAGCVLLSVILSPWLFTATFLIAILIGFSKRFHEFSILEDPGAHRSVLSSYSRHMLQSFVIMTAVMVVMVYLIYAIVVITNPYFILTSICVLFGVFQFVARTIEKGFDPETMVQDRGFILLLLIWIVLCVAILYGIQ
jgi:4-hydroxybenzoate polyprenyltransferase